MWVKRSSNISRRDSSFATVWTFGNRIKILVYRDDQPHAIRLENTAYSLKQKLNGFGMISWSAPMVSYDCCYNFCHYHIIVGMMFNINLSIPNVTFDQYREII